MPNHENMGRNEKAHSNIATKLPRKFRGRDLVEFLGKCGFKFYNIRGSHYTMIKIDSNPPKILTVPLHNPMKVGTLLDTIRKAGLTRGEFVGLVNGRHE